MNEWWVNEWWMSVCAVQNDCKQCVGHVFTVFHICLYLYYVFVFFSGLFILWRINTIHPKTRTCHLQIYARARLVTNIYRFDNIYTYKVHILETLGIVPVLDSISLSTDRITQVYSCSIEIHLYYPWPFCTVVVVHVCARVLVQQ